MVKITYVLLGIVLLAILGLVISWLGGTDQASAVNGQAEGVGNGFTYQIEVRDKIALVHVNLNVADFQAVQRYREANHQRALKWIGDRQPREIDVQITFVRPVPPSVVRELAAQTGLVVNEYLLVGRSPEGRKITSIYLGAITPDVPDVQPIIRPDGEEGGSLVGVMLLRGTVKTSQTSLGRLLDEPLIYMVDTTAVEVRELVVREYASLIADRPIEVVLHSPFWQFEW